MTHLPATYMTLAEAADRLGLSGSTLRQQARKGTLRAVLVGKTYVIDSVELDRYRDEHLGRRGRPAREAAPGVD